MTIKEIKQTLDISDKDISVMFGFKNLLSYQNSSAKKRYEKALVKFYLLTENRES